MDSSIMIKIIKYNNNILSQFEQYQNYNSRNNYPGNSTNK